MKIYVISGTTGEYSDHNEWLVKAFKNEKQAQDFVEKASARAREIESMIGQGKKYPNRWDLPHGIHELDTGFCLDYTGTSYGYDEVELIDDSQTKEGV